MYRDMLNTTNLPFFESLANFVHVVANISNNMDANNIIQQRTVDAPIYVTNLVIIFVIVLATIMIDDIGDDDMDVDAPSIKPPPPPPRNPYKDVTASTQSSSLVVEVHSFIYNGVIAIFLDVTVDVDDVDEDNDEDVSVSSVEYEYNKFSFSSSCCSC